MGKKGNEIKWKIKNSKNTHYKMDKKVAVVFPDDAEERIWEVAVAENFIKGDPEKDSVYDNLRFWRGIINKICI